MKQSDSLDSKLIKGMLSPGSLDRISKLILLEEVDSQILSSKKSLTRVWDRFWYVQLISRLLGVGVRVSFGTAHCRKIFICPFRGSTLFRITKSTGSLAIGVVVLDSLISYGYPELKLKWPNDILFDGAKLAGILVEIIGGADLR